MFDSLSERLSNVFDRLRGRGALNEADVRAAMREAYKCLKVETAKRLLNNVARALQKKHPSAAASLREGLDETLTVMGLELSPALTRSFSTTNPVENLNGRIRTTARRVKR